MQGHRPSRNRPQGSGARHACLPPLVTTWVSVGLSVRRSTVGCQPGPSRSATEQPHAPGHVLGLSGPVLSPVERAQGLPRRRLRVRSARGVQR